MTPLLAAISRVREHRHDAPVVDVALSDDGYLVFARSGIEFYDLPATDFTSHPAATLRHMQSKRWWTAEIENACLRLARVWESAT